MSSTTPCYQLSTTPEILAYIHNWHVEKQINRELPMDYVEWDCVLDPRILDEERFAERNACGLFFPFTFCILLGLTPSCCRWMDAACNADWDALLRIAAHVKYDFALGRLANATRLRSSSDPKDASTDSLTSLESSAYTALHQAAWNGAPVDIVQALIELGASRTIFLYNSLHPV
jgi:hypothetical protein